MQFRDKYWFLSNLYPCRIRYQGCTFPCVETAFQAAKGGRYWFPEFKDLDGKSARRLGRQIRLPDDWNLHRDYIMEELLRYKFRDPFLMKLLVDTYPEELVEDNYWNDYYWGRCNGQGENHLGKLLMEIRDEQILVKEDKEMSDTKFAVVIAGSRTFNNYDTFKSITDHMLSNYQLQDITIISGGAPGADSLAERYAKEHGIKTIIIKANWNRKPDGSYDRGAGYRRNCAMHKRLNDFEKKACLCFWDGESKGTRHNFELCTQYETQLAVYNFKTGKYMRKEDLK